MPKFLATITVIGSLNYDLVTTTLDRIPNAGETIRAASFKTYYGGKGSNQCLAVKKLLPELNNVQVSMVGCVGSDVFGSQLIENLNNNGINTDNVQVTDRQSTGTATIIIDGKSGQNRILVYAGANDLIDYKKDTIKQYIQSSRSETIILQNEIPLLAVESFLYQKHQYANITTVYNPSPISTDDLHHQQQICTNADYLIVNSSEARILSNYQDSGLNDDEDDVETAALIINQISAICPQSTIIITLGPNGCVFKLSGDSVQHIESVNVPEDKIVDTTGAGDTFLGAFVAHITSAPQIEERNESVANALRFAAKAAALAITRHGAAQSIPNYSDVKETTILN